MSKKGLIEEAKDTLVDAAKVGAQGVKSVAARPSVRQPQRHWCSPR